MVHNHILPAFGPQWPWPSRRSTSRTVRLNGREARFRQPRHTSPVRDDKDGGVGDTTPTTPTPANGPATTVMKTQERYLSPEEMVRLNAVLTRDKFYCPHIIAIIHLLAQQPSRLARPSTPSHVTERIVRISSPNAHPRTPSTTSPITESASAPRRVCPDCVFTTCGTRKRRSRR